MSDPRRPGDRRQDGLPPASAEQPGPPPGGPRPPGPADGPGRTGTPAEPPAAPRPEAPPGSQARPGSPPHPEQPHPGAEARPGPQARPGCKDRRRPAEGAPPARRPPAAVADDARPGDIEGALGRIRADEADTEAGRSLRRRLLTFLAILGPGLIVMVGDNDAGGIATYAQAGQDFGYSLLWVLLLLIPVLIVNQEMVVRLGAVTGVGHARLINERFGRFWGWFSVGDLFVLNFLTIVTEFIGITLSLDYFGISRYLAVPLAAGALIGITASGSFRRWEQAMLGFIAVSLLLLPLALLSHPRYGAAAYHLFVPGIRGGVTSDAVLLVIAIVGTTVAPWQLFFQQSNIIDKRITPRFVAQERADTVLGSLLVVGGACAVITTADYATRGTPAAGHFTDALGVAEALGARHPLLGALFAVVLLDASIVGAAAVTLATSYAFGDVFHVRHSLHRSFGEAKGFYISYAVMVVLAAGVVLLPGAPLGLITTAVQALAGLLLPAAGVFLLLLCNDRAVLGPWTNPPWLNTLAAVIIGVLLALSGALVATTVFPRLDPARVAGWLGAALALGLAVAAAVQRLGRRRGGTRRRPPPVPHAERAGWRMPPIALLEPVTWSPGIRLGVGLLRGYLVVAAVLLVVKAVQLGG